MSKGSASVYVAVIDSGVNREHPDLISTDIRRGWDYILRDYSYFDSTGHGTNVTGIIGAGTNNNRWIAGVNWDVAILPLRVVGASGTAYKSNVIKAVFDPADLGANIINISLGSEEYSQAEEEAISYAVSKNCIIVASAGNDGNGKYSYPASYDGVVSVASIDRDLKASDFSQYNDRVDEIGRASCRERV